MLRNNYSLRIEQKPQEGYEVLFMACKHKFIKINDVSVCVKCGLTICDNKSVVIDRKFVNKVGKVKI